MRHSPAARRAARQLPPAQLRASAASKSLNVRGNGDGDAAQLLHDWLKADLTCALVPPLYRWQFRRALDAMQRCRVEEAACRPPSGRPTCPPSQQISPGALRRAPMDYAYGIPLAIANLSPSLSPMQRLLNAITSFASFMRRDCRSLAWQSARSARGRSEHHLPRSWRAAQEDGGRSLDRWGSSAWSATRSPARLAILLSRAHSP